MDVFQIVIIFIFSIGIAFILYLIFRDPILMLKSLLRGLKPDGNLILFILFLPIWGPIWVIDKLLGLKIYIKDFEDASRPNKIDFSNYDKYIQINSTDLKYIESIITSFRENFDPNDYNYSLNGADIKFAKSDNYVLIKVEEEINFESFNVLVQYIDNSAPQNTIYHVKGILINKLEIADSYFVFFSTAFPLKLIGKTYHNKKMYVDYDLENAECEIIFYNSNIENFKNFNFDKFLSEVSVLNFIK